MTAAESDLTQAAPWQRRTADRPTRFAPAGLVDLVRACGGDERQVRAVVDAWGPQAVADLLVEEVLFRCDRPVDCGEVFLGFDLVHNDTRVEHVVRVADGSDVELVETAPLAVGMLLEYQIVDLARELLGSPSGRTAGMRATELVPRRRGTNDAAPRPSRDDVRRIARAATVITDACTNNAPDLAKLALRYASDKWGGIHWFTPHYERHFRPLRDQFVRVLEIGIGGYQGLTPGGGSLKMWKRYFTRGLVYGLDVFDKSYLDETRIQTLCGRQDDAEFLREAAELHGPFDVVIDDGSHICADVRASFEILFPYVRAGGLYVVEDLWTSYWPGYGGNREPGGDPATAVEFVKGLADALHYEEHERTDASEAPGVSTAENLVGVHVYHNIAFLEKGVNREGGIPSWIPRAPFWDDAVTRS